MRTTTISMMQSTASYITNFSPIFFLLVVVQNIIVQAAVLYEVREACCENNDITYHELLSLQKEGKIILIDVRQPSELEDEGRIPGSINIPLPELECALQHKTEEEFQSKYGFPKPCKEAKLVFYCNSGTRSKVAVEIAGRLGYLDLKHLKGGFQDWSKHNDVKHDKTTESNKKIK